MPTYGTQLIDCSTSGLSWLYVADNCLLGPGDLVNYALSNDVMRPLDSEASRDLIRILTKIRVKVKI